MDYISLDVDDFKARFKDGDRPHLLLDVRTVEEFEEGRIPGAVNIPLNELPQRITEVTAHTDQAIVVVCRSGMRSIMGAQILRRSGLTHIEIYNLEGGTIAWARRSWPLDSGE